MTARTIGEDLRVTAGTDPDRPAVIAPEGELTYGELDGAAERLARGLAHNGVQRGDRVATLLPNSLEAAIAIYGIFRAGAAISPLNPTVKAGKLTYVLDDSRARAVICDEERAETARTAAEQAAGDVRVFVGVESVPAGDGGSHRPLSVDLAGVVYTSGSTGEPKGVAVTHQTMTFVADSIIEYLEMDASERVLCVLPLSFGYGLYQLLTCVRSSGNSRSARPRSESSTPNTVGTPGSAVIR
jgi:acyl-CoA synthetase (AMP-forming)/AMP-acid ligase II